MSVIFELESPFRSSYQLHRLQFGQGSPCVAFVGGLHGNELNGIHALNLVASVLQLQKLNGTVYLLPLINSFGADEGNKRFPNDNLDINKCFPGAPKGTPSQRIAHALLEATKDADVCIDVHSGASHIRELPQVRTPLIGPELELAKAMSLPILWRREEEPCNVTGLVGAWRQRSQLALHIVGGRGTTLDSSLATIMADGITNLLSYMNIMNAIKNEHMVADVVSDNVEGYRASCGGFFVPEVRVGDKVQRGRLLGYIQSPIGGSRLVELRAKSNGIVISLRANPMIYQNELLIRLAVI